MDLYKLLYPSGLRRWERVPKYLADGYSEAYAIVDGTRVKATVRDNDSLEFSAPLKAFDEDGYDETHWIPFLNINHTHFIDAFFDNPPTPELAPQWAIYVNDKELFTVQASVDYLTRRITLGTITNVRGYDRDQRILQKDTDVLQVFFVLNNIRHELPVIRITQGELKDLDRKYNPYQDETEPYRVTYREVQWFIQPLYQYGLFDLGLSFVVPPEYWEGMQDMYKMVFGIEKTQGLVANWMPIEMANTIADLGSRIIMALNPTKFPTGSEPLISMYRYSTTTGKLEKRDTIESDSMHSGKGPLGSVRLVWHTEKRSLTFTAYRNVEQRFHELAMRNVVTLSDEELEEMEKLLQQLKRFRQVSKLQCQVCGNVAKLMDPVKIASYCSKICQMTQY